MSEETTASDRRTVGLYIEGDGLATAEITSWIRAEIVARYPLLRPEVEDLCQGVHAKLLENLHAGRFHGRSTLRTYVVSITHYTAIDRIRQIYRDRAFTSERAAPDARSEYENPYESLESAQEDALVHLTLQRSPEACRDLWRLIFLERLSYAEVGKRLSLPAGTVKSRMWYCRRKVLAIMETLKRSLGSRRGASLP